MYLCFKCANIDCICDGKMITCVDCGHKIPISSYNRGLEYARRCYKFGIMYRDAYEDQCKNSEDGKVSVLFSLTDPSNYQELITLIILSGIIGGASWELVKKAISKLYDKCKEINEIDGVYFIDDLDFEHTKQNIKEYYNYLPDVSKEVKAAISEEVMADLVEKDEFLTPENGIPNKKYYKNKLKQTRKINRKRLPKQYFSQFWDKL